MLATGVVTCDYAILHFATHGALSGQVEGSAEPGLVLTPPPKDTSDLQALWRGDGLLTASEIANLRLDADWVILSACNTAGPQGEGAEALSGLARVLLCWRPYAARVALGGRLRRRCQAHHADLRGIEGTLRDRPRRGVQTVDEGADRKGLACRRASLAVGTVRRGRRGCGSQVTEGVRSSWLQPHARGKRHGFWPLFNVLPRQPLLPVFGLALPGAYKNPSATYQPIPGQFAALYLRSRPYQYSRLKIQAFIAVSAIQLQTGRFLYGS